MVSLKEFYLKNRKLILVLLIFFSLGAIIVSSDRLVKEKNSVVAKRQQLIQLKGDLALLDGVLTDQKNSEGKIQMLSRTLPSTPQEVAFFASQLERLAGDNNQDLELKIADKAAPEQNGLLSLNISLKTSGSYDNFRKMLTDIANLPYHTKIDSIKIEPGGKGTVSLVDFRLFLGKEGI